MLRLIYVYTHRRSWRHLCARGGGDVTCGVFDELCGSCDISPVELEGREGLLLDRPNASLVAAGVGGAGAADVAEFSRRLRESELMRRLDDGMSIVGISAPTPHGPAVAFNAAGMRAVAAAPSVGSILGGGPMLPLFAQAM
jgi:hypothetical protein